MEGTAVFRWAPFAMADVAREAVDGAGLTVADLDAFIPHQANLRITETLARNLKLPDHIAIARDVQDAGNTSAASVPLAIEAMLRGGEAESWGYRPADRVRRRPELRRAGGRPSACRRALISPPRPDYGAVAGVATSVTSQRSDGSSTRSALAAAAHYPSPEPQVHRTVERLRPVTVEAITTSTAAHAMATIQRTQSMPSLPFPPNAV